MTYAGPAYAGGAYAGGGGASVDTTPVEMLGAINQAVVFGPDFITDTDGLPLVDVGVYAQPLQLEVVSTSALSTVLTELEDSFDRSFNDEANDVGSGTLTLSNVVDGVVNPDIAIASLDKMVTYKIYGKRAYSMLIESKHRVTLTEGEEHDQVTTHVGRGHATVLERAVLYPVRGVEVLPIEEDRTFNWSTPSPTYDDSSWRRAHQICTVAVGKFIWPTGRFVEGWVDLNAGVIWAPGSTNLYAPAGYCYFRKDVTIPSDGFYLLEAACDNEGELWLDGQKVIDLGGFSSTFTYSVYFTAGTHTIAVRGLNYTASDGVSGQGPAGLMVACHSVASNGDPVDVIFHTDNTWKGVFYPAKPPGMYVGEVWHLVHDEATERGVEDFDNINLKFGPRLDSAGKHWPETLDIATKVGTNYLTFLSELTSTYVDWWMKPGTLDLYMWNKGSRNKVSGVTLHEATDPTDPTSGNMYEQTHTVYG